MNRNKTAAERVAKWNRRFTADHVKTIIEAEKPLMLENATSAVNSLVAAEQATKQVLNGLGVSVSDVADYLGYSRQVWKKKGQFSGETLSIEVELNIVKWVSRGLGRSVCEAIRNEVYTIPPPSSP
jgi:ABC-type Fe2+-enterobactin transport system substrate-binding protein